MKKQTSDRKWELKMNEQRELKRQGAGMLFDRVKLLVECYDDAEFRQWHSDNGTDELEYLDDELADVACGFMTLRSVLREYPAREQWIKHNIRDLIVEILEAEHNTAEKKKQVSWKERCIAAEKECERLRAELASLQKTLEIVAGVKCS